MRTTTATAAAMAATASAVSATAPSSSPRSLAHLLQVMYVHELCADGSAVDLLQPLDNVAQRQRLLLKVFRDKGFVLKEKKKERRK